MTQKTRFEHAVAALVGVTAVLAALLAVLQLDAGRKGNRAGLLAARVPVQIFGDLAASSLRDDYHTNTLRESAGAGILALAHESAALQRLARPQLYLGFSDFKASSRMLEAAQEMKAVTLASRGVDARTRSAIEATLPDINREVKRQGQLVDDSNEFGVRQNRAVFGLSLVAIAAALFGLAAVLKAGSGGRIALATGAGALMLSLLWGVLALL